jgi:hypothetical protein
MTESIKGYLPQATTLLSYYKPMLDLVEKALEKPFYRFDMEYEKGLLGNNDVIFKMCMMRDLLSIRLRIHACQGKVREALNDIERLLQLGHAAGQGGTHAYYLLGMAFQNEAWAGLCDVLRIESPPADCIRQLGKRFATCEKELSLRNALIVSRAFGIESYLTLMNEMASSGNEDSVGNSTALQNKRGIVDYIKRMGQCISATERPFLEVRDVFENACEPPPGAAWSKILLSFVKSSLEIHANWLAMMRMSALACTVVAQRAEGGALPENLSAWILKGPKDPFTAKPFIIKTDGQAIVLYSPGPDGIDEGLTPARFLEGKADQEHLNDEWDDIFIYIPAPARKDG